MKTAKRVMAGVLIAAVMVVIAPTNAFANHDCGPPDKHDGHTYGPEVRKNPCK